MKKILSRLMAFVLIFLIAISTVLMTGMETEAVNIVPGQAYAWGIDVSAYQKNIDWNQVKAAGCSFAIIRAYTSKSGLDPDRKSVV